MIVATTERLVLRDMEERDAERIFLLNSDPEVLKYVNDGPFADIEAARDWIAKTHLQLPQALAAGRPKAGTARGSAGAACARGMTTGR